MRKPGRYATVLAVSMVALLVLAACGPAPAANAAIGSTSYQADSGPQRAVDATATSLDSVSQEVAVQDVNRAVENATVNQQISLLKVEPLGAACCPQPAPDEAMEVALGITGVQSARLLDDGVSLVVQFDPNQTGITDIASAINQAAFFVTVEEEHMASEFDAYFLTAIPDNNDKKLASKHMAVTENGRNE